MDTVVSRQGVAKLDAGNLLRLSQDEQYLVCRQWVRADLNCCTFAHSTTRQRAEHLLSV